MSKNTLSPATKSLICLTIATAITVLPSLSRAGDDTVPKRTVSYAGLDLNTKAGAQALYSQLKAAAYAACGASESVSPDSHTAWNPCIKKALGDAVATVNRRQVTQLYVATYGLKHEATDRNESVALREGK